MQRYGPALSSAPRCTQPAAAPRLIEQTAKMEGFTGRHRPWYFRVGEKDVAMNPLTRYSLNDGDGLVAAAVLGLGLMQAPYHIVEDEVSAGRLEEVLARAGARSSRGSAPTGRSARESDIRARASVPSRLRGSRASSFHLEPMPQGCDARIVGTRPRG